MMNEVLIINGERYRKCAYVDECFEKTLEGEQFKIETVMPEYSAYSGAHNIGINYLWLKLSYPVEMRFNPGEKIIISKVVD